MVKRYVRRLYRRGQLGQSIIILALGMIALLGFVGLTTDISLLFVRYSTLRRAVDSAAIAAASQVRQTGGDPSEIAYSDTIARASLSARQFIEFHGLDPTSVWVEMCENQPREDLDTNRAGLQNEPGNITEARNNYINTEGAATETERDIRQNTRVILINALVNYGNSTGVELSDDTTSTRTIYENRLSDWTSAKNDTTWDALEAASESYIEQLENDILLQLDDQEICTEDQRKLVRVTAQIESETVFLRLLGWDNITLEASAISETAVLDVVLIMDVSESMLTETTYNDWAQLNLGTAYIPPLLENPASPNSLGGNDILSRLAAEGFILQDYDTQPDPPTVRAGASSLPAAWSGYSVFHPLGTDYRPGPSGVNTGPVEPPTQSQWYEYFWLDYVMGRWQGEINCRLYFRDTNGNWLGDETTDGCSGQVPAFDSSGPSGGLLATQQAHPAYSVESFVPQAIANTGIEQGHPRPACRVRFWPFSTSWDLTNDWPAYNDGDVNSLAELYDDPNGGNLSHNDWPNIQNWDSPNNSQPRFSGFVPTYNFYGCCNDPASGIGVSDGIPNDEAVGIENGEFYITDSSIIVGGSNGQALGTVIPTGDGVLPDGNFSDLVCQPFKQARDATRAFLSRIDFLRGDRVAFVTFDRSAFLIDPDGQGQATTHMLETYTEAEFTLNQYVGVRAEPNYYVWNEDNGGWDGFSAGFDDEGNPIEIDYNALPDPAIDSESDTNQPQAVNYPVYGNCFVQNAMLQYPYTLYSSRNVAPYEIPDPNADIGGYIANYASSFPAMADKHTPDYLAEEWRNYISNAVVDGTILSEYNTFGEGNAIPRVQRSYERQAMCRGTNVGAALRESGSALTDPLTTRREGAVWIMILLGDGAAGASDPTRNAGFQPIGFAPYVENSRFDWREAVADPSEPGDTPSVSDYGSPASEYGAYGLCPYGVPGAIDGSISARVGELVNGNPNAFPWCSDGKPLTRHFCIAGERTVGWDETLDPAQSFGHGFQPNALDRDFRFEIAPDEGTYLADPDTYVRPIPPELNDLISDTQWLLQENERLGTIFDVDLGNWSDPTSPCDPLYDVDDYARDWADFIAGVDDESGTAQLPTIFTIGFGLRFENGDVDGDGDLCDDNVEDCLGEELLRYIADAGDNFRIDNDFQQDLRDNGEQWRVRSALFGYATADGSINDNDELFWGPKDSCEADFYGDPSTPTWPSYIESLGGVPPELVADYENVVRTRNARENCGNYYNAPTSSELERVFDDIASRMFTRLTG
jgi:Flp pilus assembly protein TadG